MGVLGAPQTTERGGQLGGEIFTIDNKNSVL
jgi:hypothetical protein